MGLQCLDLGNNEKLSDLRILSGLTQLSHLSLSGCTRLQQLPALPLLAHLDVAGTAVHELPLLPSLTFLSMECCNLESLPALLPSLTTLRTPYLDKNPRLSGTDLNVLSPLAPNLSIVTMQACGQLVIPDCLKDARVHFVGSS
jgi:Leucine-rich repeat (LRR) protein